MPKLIIVTRDGSEHEVDGRAGQSIMENIRDSGFDELQAVCGGCCSCATCHVYIDPAFAASLPRLSEDENDLLEGSDMRDDRSRLSCQIKFSDAMAGLRVIIAPED